MFRADFPPSIAAVVPSLEGSGVIHVLTIAHQVASFLRTQGIDAHAYSGKTEQSGGWSSRSP